MNKLILSVAMLAAGVAAAHGHGGGWGGGGFRGGFRGGGEFHVARSNNWNGGWGGGWNRGPVFVAPRPVYVAPRPVYVPPRPIYVAPRPIYRPTYSYTVNSGYGFIATLPFGAVTVMLGSQPYYFGGGSFYVSNGQGFSVVDAPIGAVVSQLPEGAQQQVINGYTYASYGNAWFVWDGNQGAWVVVQCPY